MVNVIKDQKLIFGLLFLLLLYGCIKSSNNYVPDDIDYWQSPSETIARNAGDCEDWAILYFFVHEKQNAWLIQGTCHGQGHMITIWENGMYDIANCTDFIPLLYFNRTCYHTAGNSNCNDAMSIKKWERIIRQRTAEEGQR